VRAPAARRAGLASRGPAWPGGSAAAAGLAARPGRAGISAHDRAPAEELEARLSNMPYVLECVVIQRENKLAALVFPDREAMHANQIDDAALESIMAENRKNFNHVVASYEQLFKIELVNEEFQKTPKKNIKRFLYT